MRPRTFRGPIWPYQATAKQVEIDDIYLRITFEDERILLVPIAHISFLADVTSEQRQGFRLEADNTAIWWDALDDGLEFGHLLGWKIANGALPG